LEDVPVEQISLAIYNRGVFYCRMVEFKRAI